MKTDTFLAISFTIILLSMVISFTIGIQEALAQTKTEVKNIGGDKIVIKRETMKANRIGKEIITVGNHSWIKIERYTSNNRDEEKLVLQILINLHRFEIHHPELKITNWQIDKHRKYNVIEFGTFTQGLWIDHKPNPDYQKKEVVKPKPAK